MSGYLLSVIGTVIFSALITAIMPEGKTSGLIKAVARIVCVLAIVAPVLNFLRTTSTLSLYDKKTQTFFSQSVIDEQEAFIQYYSETRIEQTQSALENEIQENYALETEVCLEWMLEDDRIKITRIVVDTKGKANGEVVKSMSEYLTKKYCSEVKIE